MRIVEFDIYNGNKAILKSDLLPLIREKLSVTNKNARFVKQHIGRSVDRIYSITLSGRFDIGLFGDIKKVIDALDTQLNTSIALNSKLHVFHNSSIMITHWLH